jgi:DNA replicative helicase MCM subunit Mcm2 (Cdc46/Mcm family)
VEIPVIRQVVRDYLPVGDIEDQVLSLNFINVPESDLFNIQSTQINTLISIRGRVNTINLRHPRLGTGVYSCPAGHLTYINHYFGDQSIPYRCHEPNCKYKKLKLEPHLSKLTDSQQVTIICVSSNYKEVEIMVDLPFLWMNKLQVSDRVMVIGILRYYTPEQPTGSVVVKMYLEAITFLQEIDIVPIIRTIIRENPKLSSEEQIDAACKKIAKIREKPENPQQIREIIGRLQNCGEVFETNNSYQIL